MPFRKNLDLINPFEWSQLARKLMLLLLLTRGGRIRDRYHYKEILTVRPEVVGQE